MDNYGSTMSEQTKIRYDFAMSSFSRMYGVNVTNGQSNIHSFCRKWAETENQSFNLKTLTEIDFYFRDNWKIWGGYV
jgi:hypothetical protein